MKSKKHNTVTTACGNRRYSCDNNVSDLCEELKTIILPLNRSRNEHRVAIRVQEDKAVPKTWN